jgi:CDP-paratose 2-epimerase
LVELDTRWELPEDHEWYEGISVEMSIDRCTHSVFGASKVAADIMVQEYGRYFEMPTVCFRGGRLTGPQHAGAQLHGFLAYLMKCTVTGDPYMIFGYRGKQVRDNIHAHDVVRAGQGFFTRVVGAEPPCSASGAILPDWLLAHDILFGEASCERSESPGHARVGDGPILLA